MSRVYSYSVCFVRQCILCTSFHK